MLDWRALTFWLAFLGIALTAQALLLKWRSRRKDFAIQRNLRTLQSNIQFLQSINSLAPAIAKDDLSQYLLKELHNVLDPLRVHVRLWIANKEWMTLEGLGEHPALRPGSPHHLPITACPAFALRRPFRYSKTSAEPCASEQFNYARHLCLPIANDQHCFGVLFLGGYGAVEWGPEEIHCFEMLSHSIALTLQRRSLIEKLEENQ